MASGYLHRLHIKSEDFKKINGSSGGRGTTKHIPQTEAKGLTKRRKEKLWLSKLISTVFSRNYSDHKIFLPAYAAEDTASDCRTVVMLRQEILNDFTVRTSE